MVSNPSTTAETVAARLVDIRARIARAADEAGRPAASVTLIAIAKRQPPARIEAALEAGHRVFGENRVQEAQGRWPKLRERYPDVTLHMVGPLQTNKAEDAVALFDAIHSVDRAKLARKLGEAMRTLDKRPACFVQVNTGEEPQKAGVGPEDADAFVAACREDYGLPVAGLMCIPPLDDDPAPHFALLAQIARRTEVPCLSMGMSADFETAIVLGATHVRVGTALFGERT